MNAEINKLDEATWLIHEYDGNASVYMYLLAGEKKAVLIDTGFGTIQLRSICESLTSLPISVILTHGHVDHIGGSGLFNHVYLHPADRKLLKMHSKEEIRRIFTKEKLQPVCEETEPLNKNSVFDLGKRTLCIIETPGHSAGSICVLDVERKWLYTGDTCCKAHVLLQMEYAATLDEYISSLETLLTRGNEYTLTWPGHHSKPVEKEIITQFLEAAKGLQDGTLQGAELSLPMGTARVLEYKDIGIEY